MTTSTLSLLTGRHPEQAGHEVFVCNITQDSFAASAWRTKRRGNQAYRLDGQPADPSLRPMFIASSEAQAANLPVRDGQVYSPGYEEFLREQGILDLASTY